MTRSSRTAWDAATAIVDTLRAAGHRALFAGGCVRDRLLGLAPKDYDVVTDAHPEKVQALFPRARLVGAKFGVVIARRFGHDIEVATFRTDGSYADGRHPDEVTFGTEQEDARRRDFTINGLFFDPHENRIIDYVGGQEDLHARVLRTIGEADRRIGEDYLRMLRAVRFAARFGLTIEPATLDAIRRNAARLPEISPERIWMELGLILSDPSRAKGWDLIARCGLHQFLTRSWPRLGPAAERRSVDRLAALPEGPCPAELAIAAVLMDAAIDTVRMICNELRISNQSKDVVRWLIHSVPLVRAIEPLETGDLKVLISGPAWTDLLALLRADLLARHEALDPYTKAKQRASAIPPERAAPPPLVTGEDMLGLGMSPGPEMGRLLRRLYREQLNETLATRDEAMARARALMVTGDVSPDGSGG